MRSEASKAIHPDPSNKEDQVIFPAKRVVPRKIDNLREVPWTAV